MTDPKELLKETTPEAIDETLRAFHYETFRAGICYGRDEWPLTEEEWADLDRGIQSEAVGEHYEGWAEETLAKLEALFARDNTRLQAELDAVRERVGRARELWAKMAFVSGPAEAGQLDDEMDALLKETGR